MIAKPVTHIPISEKDKQHLAECCKQPVTQAEQPEEYRNKVVLKPWGYEYLMFENDSVALWFLHIKKDHSTSMHCHPSKKTSLVVLSGQALCNTFHQRNFISAGGAVVLNAGVYHSTKAMSLDGISLLEVETPPAKLDLLRLSDCYGREASGYEGLSQMVTGQLDNYTYHFFMNNGNEEQDFVVNGKFSMTIESYGDNNEFVEKFTLDSGAFYCVFSGALLNVSSELLLDVGEVERGSYLSQQGDFRISNPLLLLKMFTFE